MSERLQVGMKDTPKSRRTGKVTEWQKGRWFMYLTEWDEVDQNSRNHVEIEIHYNTNQLILYTTDRSMFDDVMKKFFENPEAFKDQT